MIFANPVIDGDFIPIHYGTNYIRLLHSGCYTARFILPIPNETVNIDIQNAHIYRRLHGHNSGHSGEGASNSNHGNSNVHDKMTDLYPHLTAHMTNRIHIYNIVSNRRLTRHIISAFYIITNEGMKYTFKKEYGLIDMTDVCTDSTIVEVMIKSAHKSDAQVFLAMFKKIQYDFES